MSDDVSQILLFFQMASCLPSCASLSSCLQCCLGGVPRGSAVVGGGFCILPCCRHGGDVGFPFKTRFSQPFQEMSQLLPAALAQVSGKLLPLTCFFNHVRWDAVWCTGGSSRQSSDYSLLLLCYTRLASLFSTPTFTLFQCR